MPTVDRAWLRRQNRQWPFVIFLYDPQEWVLETRAKILLDATGAFPPQDVVMWWSPWVQQWPVASLRLWSHWVTEPDFPQRPRTIVIDVGNWQGTWSDWERVWGVRPQWQLRWILAIPRPQWASLARILVNWVPVPGGVEPQLGWIAWQPFADGLQWALSDERKTI